jgi:copper homeostasis protein
MVLEACVETYEEALRAEINGADRIELCADLHLGGITPSHRLIDTVRIKLNIPVMVMIRPRGGNFVYDAKEIRIMKQSIDMCKSLNVKGVVFGLLEDKNNIDVRNTRILADYSHPLHVTFHKAIDASGDLIKSVNELKQIPGITRILTSGGKPTALEGAQLLNKMIQATEGALKILAAGRITDRNLAELSSILQTDEFHGRRIVGDLK